MRASLRSSASTSSLCLPASLFALGAFGLAPAAALAQERAAVVSMGGTEGLDPAVFSRAVTLFEERLHDGGVEVDTGGEPRLADGCHATCRDEERRTRELDVLVVLTLEADASGTPTVAIVSVIDALGEYTVREDVEGRDAALVAELAVVQALAQRERGRRPWVSVSGTPEAAYVSVDGRDVGLVPWEGEVAPGEREVSVHLPGYETFSETITAAPGAPVELDVALRPAGSSGPGGDDTRRVALVSIGVPLVAMGVVLTSMGGAFATRAGECVDSSCTAGYVFGETEGATLGVGISSLVIGGTLILLSTF